jgi:chromosome segregation protein
MVKLDRLVMKNFKSFAGNISIPFPVNFVVVCGPNGSGKSNISDAVSFVLGATRASHIRAAKLENLVFNGGQKRKPASWCEVSMYLNNSDKDIPGYDDEIKITRKITRSGVSVYKINGKTTTRSQIIDLLLHANITPDVYNIIMQGDVTNLIEMSPLERGGIIEEISGIAEFDDKREKAYRELEAVEKRTSESLILVTERERAVRMLREEKEKAEEYVELEKTLRKAQASLYRKKIKNCRQELEKINSIIDDKAKLFETVDDKIEEDEKDLEELEKQIDELTEEIISKSKNTSLIEKIADIKTQIETRKSKMELKESFGKDRAVQYILDKNIEGVYGVFDSLIKTEPKYSTAIQVAVGRHSNDLVVENDSVAAECIKKLRAQKIGRARFIPLNKIKGRVIKNVEGAIDVAINLIDYSQKYGPAVEYVLGSTLVASDVDIARKLGRYRISTLDGDLIESSGAMIGGFLRKMRKQDNSAIIREIEELEKQMNELEKERVDETNEVKELQEKKDKLEQKLDAKHREKARDERLKIQEEIGNLKADKAGLEAKLDNLESAMKEFSDIKNFIKGTEKELEEKARMCRVKMNQIGPVNMKAIEEYSLINTEFEELKKKLDKLLKEKKAIEDAVTEIEKKRKDKFMGTLGEISGFFRKIYKDLTGGPASLRLENEDDISSGLVIEASPAGKKVVNIDSMSGGEKTLTSLAFLFAVQQHYSAPFYILDEVDAALDKVNTRKIAELIKKYSKDVQFIVISHNDLTIQSGDQVFGVSMEEGVSKVFAIQMPDK